MEKAIDFGKLLRVTDIFIGDAGAIVLKRTGSDKGVIGRHN